MSTVDVKFEQLPTGAALKIDQSDGPLIVIEQDGNVTVTRGPHNEAGRLFWEAVKIHGDTYREKIARQAAMIEELRQVASTLQHDPWRDAVSNGLNVWNKIPKAARKTLTRTDMHAVLEAVTRLAMEKMQ
jgi:hypothetical protein